MDPLVSVINLLKPRAVGTKIVCGAGHWSVRYPAFGQPSFALVLQGPFWLAPDEHPPVKLETGEFIFFAATPAFTLGSGPGARPGARPPSRPNRQLEEVVYGDRATGPEVRLLGGYFAVDPLNAPLLLSFLPRVLHMRASDPAIAEVAPLVELIRREAGASRPGQAFVLTRLVEVLLVEALRSVPGGGNETGFLAGLRDGQLAAALRGIHLETTRRWTVATLARLAGMSRSSFAERFARVVGMAPLTYLLQWRLALAKQLLISEGATVAQTALAVGYESASSFSTAFSREVGRAPKEFIPAPRGDPALPSSIARGGRSTGARRSGLRAQRRSMAVK